MPRLPLKKYAELVCQAVGENDFPAVTINFGSDSAGGEGIEPCEHDGPGPMLKVEAHILCLLCSPDRAKVRDGLSNVLYWGWANAPGFAKAKVERFRDQVADDDPRLSGFAKGLTGAPGARLLGIRDLALPQFGGMSFATKILMFLDPADCPVLDSKIARAFAEPRLPLQKLVLPGFIGITERNAAAYESWARWCKAIAATVNADSASPRHDLRAVDVERALFTLVGKRDTGDTEAVRQEAARQLRQLRQGPLGWKLRSEFE